VLTVAMIVLVRVMLRRLEQGGGGFTDVQPPCEAPPQHQVMAG